LISFVQGNVPTSGPAQSAGRFEKDLDRLPRHMSRYAFLAFALVFIAFLVVFPMWLLNSSDYLNWSPSEKYNAVPMSNGSDENRLFKLSTKLFSAKQTAKVVKSSYRFTRLHKNVIAPKLREIGFLDE